MSEPKSVLYRNWIKAGVALWYTKQGCQKFIETIIEDFACDIYGRAVARHGHPTGTICTSCTTENVLRCKTAGICTTGRRCSFHDDRDPRKTSRPCPQKICDFIRDKLIETHRFRGPSFKNTWAEDWSRSSWEMAKCFLQESGYKDKRTAEDTDLAGLLSVILNHTLFQAEVAEDLSVRTNIFAQVREIRNKVMHDANMQVHSKDLHVYFNVLIKLLSDPIRLKDLPEAQESIKKLNELQNNLITITVEDEQRVREESLLAIREATEEGLLVIENKKISVVSELEDKQQEVEGIARSAEDSIKRVSSEGANALKDLRTEISQEMSDKQQHALSVLKSQTQDSVQTIYDRTKGGITEIKEEVRKGVHTITKEVVGRFNPRAPVMHGDNDAVLDDARDRLEGHRLTYEKEKKEMRASIIRQYQENFCAMPFSPLIQEEEIGVDKLFVMPSMRVVQHDLPKTFTGSLTYRYIKTFKGLFRRDDLHIRRVYILSDAGRGKTTVCQMLIHSWCMAHSASEGTVLNDDEEFLKSFEFLFYLPLRDMTHLYYTTDMIKALLVREKYHHVLDKVMREDSENCLLILDGLDEWSAPDGEYPGKGTRHLPFIDPREEFTILTTTRPWKLEAVRIKTSKIDQEVQLTGINERTAELLVSKLLTFLNNKFKKNKKASIFMDEIKGKNLLHLTEIPFILMQIVCLWHDGREYGNSQVEVYRHMIDFIVELAKERFDADEYRPTQLLTDIVLGRVAELAFNTLFRKDANSMIVFSVLEENPFNVNISKDDISFCLRLGLLSESKHVLLSTARMKSLSFLHKTFHEFFAATFISSSNDRVKDMLDRLATVNTIFEMERVLVFLSGLRPDVVNTVIEHIAKKTDTDELFLEYRQSASSRRYYKVEENVLGIQNLVLECITEGVKDDFSQIDLILRDVTTIDFENKYTEKHMRCLNIEGVRSIAVDHAEIPFLLPPFLESETKSIVKLNGYLGSQEELDIMKAIIERTQESIQCIGICSSRFAKPALEDGLNLDTLLQPVDGLRNLSCIEFERVDLTHARILKLVGFLHAKVNLRQLLMCEITCTTCDVGACGYAIDLSNHMDIELISLTALYVDDIRVNPSKLHSCHLQTLHNPSSVTSLLRCVRESTSITSLSFGKHISIHEKYRESVATLMEVVPTLRRLQHLSLKAVVVPETGGLVVSPDMAELEYVALVHVTIGLQQFMSLMDSLPLGENELEVIFHELRITPAESIPRAIQSVVNDERFQVLRYVPKETTVSLRLKYVPPSED